MIIDVADVYYAQDSEASWREELRILTERREVLNKELARLETDLARFEHLYNEMIGLRLVLLDELEADIARYVAASRPDDTAAQQNAEDAWVRAVESAHSLGRDFGLGTKLFVGEQEQSHRVAPDAPCSDTNRTQSSSPVNNSDVTQVSENPSLKSLYRQIAQLIHPDLFSDPEVKVLMGELMVEANHAREHGDWVRLQEFLEIGRNLAGAISPDTVSLFYLSVAADRLRREVANLEGKLIALRDRDLFRLMQRVDKAPKNGTELLAQMKANIDTKIADARTRLAAIIGKEEA